MVARQGIHLAVFLVKSHFGDPVSKICECLLNRGSLTLHELVRFTELDPFDKESSIRVKKCLLVLIQHNCVQAFSVPRTGAGAVTVPMTKYMALLDNILHRLRFAKFLAIVRSDLGTKCETLVEGLLQHGRLTFDQLVQRAVSAKKPDADIRASFNKLVHAHYVERCPRSDPFIAPNPDDENKSSKGRGSKNVQPPSIEQQAIIAATLSDAERFSGISDTETNTIVDEKVTEPRVAVGDKRRHELLEVGDDIQAAISENEILWRANFEKFVQCLKKKACVENIRSRFGIDAGMVLEAMIESNFNLNTRDNSVTASMDAILEGVRGKPGGISMTLEHVRVILEQLGCRLCTEETGALYTIDLKGVIEACQNDEVETIVSRKYGNQAYRVFRLLVKKGWPVETDQVASITFIEKNEAQLILTKLWKDDFLDVEKANISGGGYSYFLWRVKKDALWEHVLDDMYHAALNLSQRAAHMTEQDPESLDSRQVLLYKKRRLILQLSLTKLDDALMLFHDF